jgi:MFS transporter, DHA2 family, multidrug resistance protein
MTAPSAGIPLRSKLIILTAVLASLLEIIDTSIVNVAIPTMMGNLGTTLDEISWVVTGYIIANAVVLPISGWLSEQLGRKLYYTTCIVLFTVSSFACGFAPNLTTLIVFRILQGLAGGALLPTSQALIYEAFPKEQAGMASAIYGMSVMIGPTVGPTLGGYLTDNLGWRSIFNVNVPIGIVVCILSFFLVEDVGYVEKVKGAAPVPVPPRKRTPVDSLGLMLLVVGIGCLQYVLERGHADDWFDSNAIAICTVLAVICLIGLVWWELRTPHPILQLRHFQNPTFRSGVMLMFAMGCMLYGLIFIIPVFCSSELGLTATQTGELFIPGALASAAMMPFIGNQLRKRDPRILIFVGVVSLAYGAYLIGKFDSLTSREGMFWPLMLRGAAMAYLFVPINTVVLTQFSGSAIGEAAGMLNLMRQMGGSIAIAIMSTLFQNYTWEAYLSLSKNISRLNPISVQMEIGLERAMRGKFMGDVGLGTPSSEAVKLFYYNVQRQAFALGYQKVLIVVVILFLILALVPLALMKPRKIVGGPVLDAH